MAAPPVPLDPPALLVASGPYAYVANPMQLGATVVLAGWGLLLASPAVVAGRPQPPPSWPVWRPGARTSS